MTEVEPGHELAWWEWGRVGKFRMGGRISINESAMNADDRKIYRIAETIERLRSRITQYGADIGGHETRTRVVLIDPLLRSLGWDTEDPATVVHEHRAGNLKLDYALYDRGQLVAILEAKVLGSRLNDTAWGKYVAELPNVPVVAFTIGDEWRFFRKANKWHPETIKVSSGESFRTGWEINQIIGRDAVQALTPEPSGHESRVRPNNEHEDSAWHPLSTVSHSGPMPTRIRFGDGTEREIPSWRQLFTLVATHLVEIGKVRSVFWFEGMSRDVICAQRAYGSDPSYMSRISIGRGLWLERTRGRQQGVSWSNRILKAFDIDPATVQVSFD